MRIPKTLLLVSGLLLPVVFMSCQTSESDAWKEMKKVCNQISLPTFPDRTYVITDFYNGKDSL